MKKKRTVLIALLAAALIAAGCGRSMGSNVEQKTEAEEDAGAITTQNDEVEAESVIDSTPTSAEKTDVQEVPGSDEAEISDTTDVQEVPGSDEAEISDTSVVTGQEDGNQWDSEDDGWKNAYLQVMEEYSWNIHTYEDMLMERAEDWKDHETFSTADLSVAQMCLEDLDGDRIPELLFVADTDDEIVEYPEAQHDLYVFTYKDGEAVLICRQRAALEAGGGWQYYVAKEADQLVLVCTANDLFQHTEILWYRCNGKLPMELVKRQCLLDDHHYAEYVPAYRTGESIDDLDNLQEISEEEYVRLSHEATEGFGKILIRNMHSTAPVYDYEKDNWDSVNAMTSSELYNYLLGSSDSRDAAEMDSVSEYFTNEQLDHIRQSLGIPDDLPVDVEVGAPSYWEGGGMDLVQVDFYHEGEYAAGAACKPYTEEIARNIYTYMGDD